MILPLNAVPATNTHALLVMGILLLGVGWWVLGRVEGAVPIKIPTSRPKSGTRADA